MKLAIMQPYLFPYIGYFQLLKACDEFIIYDDVQFIKSGWINRNRLLSNGKPCYFNFRIHGGSTFEKINEKSFVEEINRDKTRFLKSLCIMYGKAPCFQQTFDFISQTISLNEMNISRFVTHTLRELCKYFSIDTCFHIASELNAPKDLQGQDRVIWFNEQLRSDTYINVISGNELYDKDIFQSHGLSLQFLKPMLREYPQFKNNFVAGLSIVDVMMFNTKDEIAKMLTEYQLL